MVLIKFFRVNDYFSVVDAVFTLSGINCCCYFFTFTFYFYVPQHKFLFHIPHLGY